MSLILNALPDQRSQIDSLQRALEQKTLHIAHLSERVAELEDELRRIEVGAANLRVTLAPLYNALQLVFGHIDAMNVRDDAPPVSAAKKQVWDSWKQKLGGLTAKAIDILFLHGPMNQTQLRIQLSCASRSVTNIVTALNKAGLINKVDGGKIALKEL